MTSNKKMQGEFTYKLSNNELYKKDNANYINALGIDQLARIGNVYLLDVFLSKGNCVELHYHPNATELIYCISGEAELSFINMDNKEWQSFTIERGEVVTIPQGWWHYVCAKKDYTHLLAIHDTNQLETIFGSDLFRLTPDEVLAKLYCLNEEKVEEALSPIHETVVIGPPADCEMEVMEAEMQKVESIERMNKSHHEKGHMEERENEMPKMNHTQNMQSVRSMEKRKEAGDVRLNWMHERNEMPPMGNSIDQRGGGVAGEGQNDWQMQPFLDFDNQAISPYGGYYVQPMNICPGCLGFYSY
ncbi:cupin domain-containing protein [Pseudogracilibacillus auburnensis]|uniref:Cupin type-1 domain-containing protein n=1 Tax=Pseudogracilibacillus auburnensis TaxID=1494959 RepID=A0A2V3W484_9BACI|nr:cupin domain-containing protein [Pseudogracilibacillus auburnensis]PXW87994.1 hypothetical protein DFR56_104145 [Pseudogracilibacillus auburnensis]